MGSTRSHWRVRIWTAVLLHNPQYLHISNRSTKKGASFPSRMHFIERVNTQKRETTIFLGKRSRAHQPQQKRHDTFRIEFRSFRAQPHQGSTRKRKMRRESFAALRGKLWECRLIGRKRKELSLSYSPDAQQPQGVRLELEKRKGPFWLLAH